MVRTTGSIAKENAPRMGRWESRKFRRPSGAVFIGNGIRWLAPPANFRWPSGPFRRGARLNVTAAVFIELF